MSGLLLREVIHEACVYVRNAFVEGQPQFQGDFAINNGSIILNVDLRKGQWLAMTPKIGVFKIIADFPNVDSGHIYALDKADAFSHEWSGIIYACAMPPPFVRLCERIREWRNSDEGKPSTLIKDSMANAHSYTYATGADGKPLTWQDVFSKELRLYRRQMLTDVDL